MPQDIPHFLVRKPGRPYNPYSGWKTYKSNEIVFSSKEHITHWDVHPRGVIAEIGPSLLVDGKDKVYDLEKEMGGGLYVARFRRGIYCARGRQIFN